MEPNGTFFFPQRQELWILRVEMQGLTGGLEKNLVISSFHEWANQGAGSMAGGASELVEFLRACSGCPRIWAAGLQNIKRKLSLEPYSVTHSATIWNGRILEQSGNF